MELMVQFKGEAENHEVISGNFGIQRRCPAAYRACTFRAAGMANLQLFLFCLSFQDACPVTKGLLSTGVERQR